MKSPIKLWQESQGLTQHDMAEKIGWTQQFYCEFVNGKYPKIDCLKFDRLLEITGLEYDVLMDWIKALQDDKDEVALEAASKEKSTQIPKVKPKKKVKTKTKKVKSKKSN